MSKKKSLGHNPLAYSTRRHSSFDFITSSEQSEQEEDAQSTPNGEKVKKITASYYLEKPLVKKIKYLADQKDTSYSALVNDLLKNSLRNLTAD